MSAAVHSSSRYQRQARTHRVLNNGRCVSPVCFLCRFDDLTPALSHTTKTFGEIANGEVHQPDWRQAQVRAACMTDSRRRVPINTEHVVVDVGLFHVLHLDVLHRPAHDLSIEVTGCQGVRDRQIEPRNATRTLRGVARRAAVIRGMRRMATIRKLPEKKRDKLEEICNYYCNNQHRMRYDEYLRAGYPIASGVIEGACRHVVKDRMERAGMSWIVQGAQAMLELRCIQIAGDWDEFTSFRIEKHTQRLYPYREALTQIPWLLAA